jgi:hypothetical protein
MKSKICEICLGVLDKKNKIREFVAKSSDCYTIFISNYFKKEETTQYLKI